MKNTTIALDKFFHEQICYAKFQRENSVKFLKIFVFLLLTFSVNLYSQTTVTLNSGNSWTVPCGVTSVTVEVWGAGGGGGSVINSYNSEGAGGSGGGFVRNVISVTPNSIISYSIGNGGLGNGNGSAKNGTATWFVSASTLLAVGGVGASNVTQNNFSGTPATALTTGNTSGGISRYGGNGGAPVNSSGWRSGGGGSSAGTVTGNNATNNIGGAAPANGYAGANGVLGNAAGINGNIGAGGSGAARANGTGNSGTSFGGNGGAGQIRITYTAVISNIASSSLAYGTNVWNVYGWNGGNISGGDGAWVTDYRGYYVNSNLDFSAAAHWQPNASPSSATGWVGCPVDLDDSSFSAKRQGFPCGLYRIDVVRNDDLAQLYVNDALVWSRPDWSGSGATPAENLNVWQGTLGPADRVEFRVSEGLGDWHGHITFTVVAPTAPTVTGPPSNIICSGTNTTLTASGSNVSTDTSTLWFLGATCPTIGFIHEFQTNPYVVSQTTVNSVNSGILNVTSANVSPADPMIYMENVLTSPINTTVQRYISMRYRVVSGTAIMTEVYFKKGALVLAEDKVVRGNLISDGSWHVLSLDMGANPNWNNTGGNNITGWRFDYTTGANVRMEIDYIVLASAPVMENTAANDSSITVSPTVSPTSYTVLKVAESPCHTISACTTIPIYVNKTWIGGTGNWNVAANWSPSGVPTSDHCVVGTSGNITLNTNGNAKTVTLTNTTALTIPSNNTLTVADNISIGSNANFTIQDSGSLLQTNNTTNSGNIRVIRTAKPMERYDFTYWSSPVAGQNLLAFSPLTFFDKYYSWNPVPGSWVTYNFGNGTMNVGSGYAIRAPQTFSTTTPSIFTGTFTGVPNNGEVTVTGFQGSTTTPIWNLIGNPYPSAIDIKLFLTDPDNTEVGGTIYLWTHNTPPSSAIPGNQAYNYTTDDYATFNLVGGVATASPAIQNPTDPSNADDNNNTLVNGLLASGQAFFIRGIKNTEDIAPGAGGPIRVKFKNSMRIAGNNANFFKPGPSDPINNWETTGQHRFWLNLQNSQGAFNQTLVGYVENATNGLDRLYDGEVFGGNYVTIYSLLEENKLTIQGKALPFNDQDIVPIGYKTTISGTFNINLDHFDGLFEGQDIYLKDKLLNVLHNLKESAYSFTSAIGTFDSRFEIVYQSQALGIENPEINPESIIIYKNKNASVVVNAGTLVLDQIRVYDIAGRLLFESKKVNNSQAIIENLPQTQQVLIVDVVTIDGFKATKKVIF